MRDPTLAAFVHTLDLHNVITRFRECVLRDCVAILRMRTGVAIGFHIHRGRAVAE